MIADGDALAGVGAIACDVGGTVLDWHGGVSGALTGVVPEPEALARRWRRIAIGGLRNSSLVGPAATDAVHDTSLVAAIAAQHLDPLDPAIHRQLVGAWRTIAAWPDVAAGLARLRSHVRCCTLTLLDTALVVDASRRNGLVWDAVFTCEMIGARKPSPEVYEVAATWLGLEPSQVLMVASHGNDLRAAAAVGYRTAFVRRPYEWGPTGPVEEPPQEAQFVVEGFGALADLFEARVAGLGGSLR
jgi:2-haloacid dehalogenase